jgi:Ca2+-transporting ATPase
VVATVVAFAMGETVERVAILAVILLNATARFWTEWRAERVLTALQKQAAPAAPVVRDGNEHQVPAADLVPGDVVVLNAGDRVRADGWLVEAARLQVEEAALTGDSVPVNTGIDPVADPAAPLGKHRGMAYLGTAVTDGRGRFLVTAT